MKRSMILQPGSIREILLRCLRRALLGSNVMREELKKINRVRARFNGLIVRFASKPGYRGHVKKTMLLQDVHSVRTGKLVTDHLWFTVGKWCEGMKEGDAIEFDARVTTYKKGYRGHREDVWDAPPPSIDYRLSHPTNVKRLSAKPPDVTFSDRPVEPMPTEQAQLFA